MELDLDVFVGLDSKVYGEIYPTLSNLSLGIKFDKKHSLYVSVGEFDLVNERLVKTSGTSMGTGYTFQTDSNFTFTTLLSRNYLYSAYQNFEINLNQISVDYASTTLDLAAGYQVNLADLE